MLIVQTGSWVYFVIGRMFVNSAAGVAIPCHNKSATKCWLPVRRAKDYAWAQDIGPFRCFFMSKTV